MKLTKLSLAVVAALGAANAHALAPNAAHTATLYIGGATAVENQVFRLLVSTTAGVCDSTQTRDYFRKSTSEVPSKDYWGVSCITNQAIGTIPAGSSIRVIKRSSGGSAYGVNPLMDDVAVTHLNVNSCTDTGTNITPVAAVGSLHVWNCTADASVKSDAGISDVNPELFYGKNNPSTFPGEFADVIAADVPVKLDVAAAGLLSFGIPANDLLYAALQDAQIKQGKLAASCQPTRATTSPWAVTTDTSEACMPSLSKQQVTSLLTGVVPSWDFVMVGSTPLTAYVDPKFLPTWDGSSQSNPGYNGVHICRRVNGSGTQATTNANLLHYPCSSTASIPADKGTSGNADPAALMVFENSGSGDVEKCLTDFNNASNTGTAPAVQQIAETGLTSNYRSWAIGVQATEKNASHGKPYRFVKIDGVSPTLANIHDGKYFDFGEVTMQWRNDWASNPANANALEVAKFIRNQNSKPVILQQINTELATHTWGTAGYLTLHDAALGNSADNVFVTSNPVSPFSHKVGNLDNCRAPAFLFDVLIDSAGSTGMQF